VTEPLRGSERGSRSKRLAYCAVATAVVTFLLLSVGGVVTSRDAGLVFPDWPLSDGSVNPDGWIVNPDQRAEHGHRLLGALGGILAITLAVWTWRAESRKSVRWLAVAVVVGFGLQGLLGGLRVTEQSGPLALVHGCTGQMLFASVVSLAYLLSRDGTREHDKSPANSGVALACAAAAFVIFMQVVLGASLRHHRGPIQPHLFGAMIVLGTVAWTVTIVFARSTTRALRRPAMLLGGLILFQIVLGIGANAILRGIADPSYTLAEVVLPTLHQAVGALLLATSVVLALRAARRSGTTTPELQGAVA